jgi:metallophosphoesterase superfamily enzyme
MRNIKIGMPVFLKKNSPAKAIIIIPATTEKTRGTSILFSLLKILQA